MKGPAVTITLDAIRNCLDGAVPGSIATVAADGTPNLALLSQVQYVDNEHVALSFQFFSKTRENVQVNPRAMVQVVDPDTAAHYRLELEYLRTETAGALFENMKAKLAGIASHTGMSKVFVLKGADVYRVHAIEAVQSDSLPCPLPRRSLLPALRAVSTRLSGCHDLDGLFDETLDGLRTHFDVPHAMLLMYDRNGDKLYTVASRGYADSGVGSEIPLGAGVIGVAARERTPIRITHWTADYAYSHAMRQSLRETGKADALESEIPFPGLAEPRSQLAVPILSGDALLGVLCVESPEDMRFNYEDEDALVTLAHQLALAMQALQLRAEPPEDRAPLPGSATRTCGEPVVLRRYPVNDSVFIDQDYLIKGVAGAIFWKLASAYHRDGRTEFNNRELRLDPTLRLPDISDNLEARLILLQRRLAERCDFLAIEKTGRGRFRLRVDRPLQLIEMSAQG